MNTRTLAQNGPSSIKRGAGGVVTFGSARFSRTEAAYIHAHAGQLLTEGTRPRPVGISDARGRRWLLSCPNRDEVSVMRHDVSYSFPAAEIQKRLRPHRFSTHAT